MSGTIGKRSKIDVKRAMAWVIIGPTLRTWAVGTQYAVNSHHYPHRVIYSNNNNNNFNTNSKEKDRRSNKE